MSRPTSTMLDHWLIDINPPCSMQSLYHQDSLTSTINFFGVLASSSSAANVRLGHQDPGESQEGRHGHLPADRHHSQAVRRGPAAELGGHVQDVQLQSGQVAPREGGSPGQNENSFVKRQRNRDETRAASVPSDPSDIWPNHYFRAAATPCECAHSGRAQGVFTRSRSPA